LGRTGKLISYNETPGAHRTFGWEKTFVQIGLSGIVIVVGNYGSGKTEVAINLAVHQHRLGTKVRMADLDLVNPYFRTREARTSLNALGIEVILPPEQLMQADLPILMPQVAGLSGPPATWQFLMLGAMTRAPPFWPRWRMYLKIQINPYG
jgi:Mrp family chromosome partitioning ATPase